MNDVDDSGHPTTKTVQRIIRRGPLFRSYRSYAQHLLYAHVEDAEAVALGRGILRGVQARVQSGRVRHREVRVVKLSKRRVKSAPTPMKAKKQKEKKK